jgi:hypothetical protein
MTRRPALTSLRPALHHFRPLVPAGMGCAVCARFRLAKPGVVRGGLISPPGPPPGSARPKRSGSGGHFDNLLHSLKLARRELPSEGMAQLCLSTILRVGSNKDARRFRSLSKAFDKERKTASYLFEPFFVVSLTA